MAERSPLGHALPTSRKKGVDRINGHTHLLGGLAAGAIAAPALAFGHIPAFLIAAALAGPLADIDHPGSMYGKWVPLPGVAKINGHIEPFRRGPFGNSERSFGHVGRVLPGGILWHRAATHSLTAALVFSTVFYLLAWRLVAPEAVAIGLGVLTGYLSHLVLDAFNIMGQELLWPFSRRRFKIGPLHIPVGSLGETMTVVVLAGVLLLTLPHLLPVLLGHRLFGGVSP